MSIAKTTRPHLLTREAAAARIEALEAALLQEVNAAYDHGFRAGTAMRADRIEALEAENNQLQAKLYCVCGSSVDHSDYEGHSPVSMYDYALDGANKRIEALEAALREIVELAPSLYLSEIERIARAALAPEQDK